MGRLIPPVGVIKVEYIYQLSFIITLKLKNMTYYRDIVYLITILSGVYHITQNNWLDVAAWVAIYIYLLLTENDNTHFNSMKEIP